MNRDEHNLHSGTTMEESLASITAGIDHLETFLDQLTQTLAIQTIEVEELSDINNRQEHDNWIFQSNNSFSQFERHNEENMSEEQSHLRPTRYQMGREMGPRIQTLNTLQAGRTANQDYNADENAYLEREESHNYLRAAQLDHEVQFGRSNEHNYETNHTFSEDETNDGIGSNRSEDEAVISNDHNQNDANISLNSHPWRISVLSGIGRVLLPQQLNGISLGSNIRRNNNGRGFGWDSDTNEALPATINEEHGRDEDGIFMMENSSEDNSDEDEETDRLIFFGIVNGNGSINNSIRTVRNEEEETSNRRKHVKRDLSPNTLSFYERIGIHLDSKDNVQLKNPYKNYFVLPNPTTIPDGNGLYTPLPLYNEKDEEIMKELQHQIHENEKSEHINEEFNGNYSKTNEINQDFPSSNTKINEKDSEDEELEKLIEEFKRNKLTKKSKNRSEDIQNIEKIGNLERNDEDSSLVQDVETLSKSKEQTLTPAPKTETNEPNLTSSSENISRIQRIKLTSASST